ncbi:MAG: porin family protein [Prevotellaceae bacterium]|jgi:opacity protein-like surface antigen|nr:porin family protein [Prevotellaceae bacterium]
MKKIIFITLIAFVSFETSAQFKLGIKGGWDFENFNISGNVGNQLKKDKSTSWNLGAVAQFPLTGNLHLQPEVLYSTQKSTLNSGNAKTEYKMSYFKIPVNLLYKFNIPVVNPYISFGPYLGYIVNRNDISKNTIKKTDWGISVGAGVEFLGFQLSANYNWALQNISDVSNIKWKNNKFNVSVAFFIL